MKFVKDEIVAVCYDGKWGRAVEGKVIEIGVNGKGNSPIKVRFLPWANETSGFVELECKVPKRKPSPKNNIICGNYLIGNGELGIIKSLGGRGDWYSIWPSKDLIDCGYKIQPYDRSRGDLDINATPVVKISDTTEKAGIAKVLANYLKQE